MSYNKETDPTYAHPPINYDMAPPPYSMTDAPIPHGEAPTYEAAPGYSATTSTSGGIAGVSSRFPQTINAYFGKKVFKTFYVGEHADSPLFAVTMHSGVTSKPLLELRGGLRDSDPIIATADNESRWSSGRNAVIKILGTPAGHGPTDDEGYPEQTFPMKQQHVWKNVSYQFTAEIGRGKDVRREDFEWRRSRGGEVHDLNGTAAWGWKLVRLSSGDQPGAGGTRETRAAGETSDGKEVVAVWAMNYRWSTNKMFRFQFLSSSATGLLGERFALAALITALKLWHLEYLSAIGTDSGTAAGVAASASVA
ncbi:hypothetical protein AAE478_008686 [Parahypoxylon ruwenzoriense]